MAARVITLPMSGCAQPPCFQWPYRAAEPADQERFVADEHHRNPPHLLHRFQQRNDAGLGVRSQNAIGLLALIPIPGRRPPFFLDRNYPAPEITIAKQRFNRLGEIPHGFSFFMDGIQSKAWSTRRVLKVAPDRRQNARALAGSNQTGSTYGQIHFMSQCAKLGLTLGLTPFSDGRTQN